MITKLKAGFSSIQEMSQEDEIRFFKLIKPKFTAELHFQMANFQYCKGMPKGTIRKKKRHINQNMEKEPHFIWHVDDKRS
ncbi:hypothetical protein [Marinoscillum furvescens]|uniref:Uncharacterized protein n=1 Tax=Marinoscillum furvescens DSM 4134 TaxID=1122208 RepID=A0A3D9L0H2_MARFU|nr:hypothetical protein [Marinoscillum furvescens]RED96679.1 hypothetical protein C7460_114138 [Marinoscillum furvescens DSM 4134]